MSQLINEQDDFLAGLNEMTSAMGNGQTATDEFQGTGQKGLDYSDIDPDVVLFTPAENREENRFDVIPFIVKMAWYEKLLWPPPSKAQKEAGQKYSKPRGRKPGQADICFEIPLHRFADGDSGDVVCLREAFNEKCPYCEMMFKLYEIARETGDESLKTKGKEIRASWRTFFNIYNHNFKSNPNAPADHDGYEIIDDIGRSVLQQNIQICSSNTKLGEGFVYPYAHPVQGYTLVADSVYNAPTNIKFKKGFTEFPIIKFEKRPEGTDYTQDIHASVSFDVLCDKLIFTYEEMSEFLKQKAIKMDIDYNGIFQKTDDQHDTPSSYSGTLEGNGIQPKINELGPPAYNDPEISGNKPGRRNRGARTTEPEQQTHSENTQTAQVANDDQPQSSGAGNARRRRRQ